MDFSVFSGIASKLKHLPLPGMYAQGKMTHPLRYQQMISELPAQFNPKQAAVLALFFPDENNSTQLLLIKRADDGQTHAGQIAFPGGRCDLCDTDHLDTALREAREEVGIYPGLIREITPLTPLYIPPSNHLVHPFMGIYPSSDFIKDTREVAALIHWSADNFIFSPKYTEHEVVLDSGKKLSFPAFDVDGETVWGATAMILSEIRALVAGVVS
jgi:8-oxo-dGTP pyrophosphatase MutT (NUDIX family)